MRVATIGLDPAKHVFQVHGVDAAGTVLVRKPLRRSKLLAFFAGLDPALVGMEARGSAHHWARELARLGHRVRLMPPAYVKPYVKRQKNDAADAEAIREAVTRPSMRFVPIRSEAQQGALMLHRTRDLLIRQRTMLGNALRGHLAELGVIERQGTAGLKLLIAAVEDEADARLPAVARRALLPPVAQLRTLHEQADGIEQEIGAWHRSSEVSRRLDAIPGIGPIVASALVATVTDPSAFGSGRQLAAWLGPVPRRTSTGGKGRLGRITKQGDPHLRRLLVIGASAVLRHAVGRTSPLLKRAEGIRSRKPAMVASVALADKLARIIAWAVMGSATGYRGQPVGA